MLTTAFLSLALVGQIPAQFFGPASNQASQYNWAMMGGYDAWRARQNAAFLMQNEEAMRADYERFAAQQKRLAATKTRLRARMAIKPEREPAKPVKMTPAERQAQIQRNLDKTRQGR